MRKMLGIILGLLSGVVWATPLACLIEPQKAADLGTTSAGIIEHIAVERGDFVTKGQVLAYLKADVEHAARGVAATRAESEAEIKAAKAANDLAQLKWTRAQHLRDVGFVSQEAVEQAEVEARLAQHRVQQAQEGQAVSHRELILSSSQLAQRTIRSPFSGIVVERYRTEGERVEREPLLRIARIDPLRVEVIMPATEFGQIKKGASASIKTAIPGVEEVLAKVVLIDPFIDAASNSFRVRLTLPNPNYRIPAGLRCSANFGAKPATPAPASLKPGVSKVSYTLAVPAAGLPPKGR